MTTLEIFMMLKYSHISQSYGMSSKENGDIAETKVIFELSSYD